MPVYVQHYRPWQGTPRPRWLRWTVITRYQLRQLFTGKGRFPLTILLVLSGSIHLVFLAFIYFTANLEILSMFGVPPARLPKINPRFFFATFFPQGFLVGLLALFVGSGLIADDRRDNAIPMYLSKPLTPTEYLLGKFCVLAVFTLGITAVPVNFLFLCEVLMHGGWAFCRTYWWLPLSITAFSLLITLLCGAVMLMASSFVKKAALAGVLAVGLFFGHNFLAVVLQQTFNDERLFLLSLQFACVRVGHWLFQVPQAPFPFSVESAAGVILGVTLLCLAIVRWRIRPVEVVK